MLRLLKLLLLDYDKLAVSHAYILDPCWYHSRFMLKGRLVLPVVQLLLQCWLDQMLQFLLKANIGDHIWPMSMTSTSLILRANIRSVSSLHDSCTQTLFRHNELQIQWKGIYVVFNMCRWLMGSYRRHAISWPWILATMPFAKSKLCPYSFNTLIKLSQTPLFSSFRYEKLEGKQFSISDAVSFVFHSPYNKVS